MFFCRQLAPHPNVVMLRGVTVTLPIVIVTDFCEDGSLYALLHSHVVISMTTRVGFMLDIAKGMVYTVMLLYHLP